MSNNALLIPSSIYKNNKRCITINQTTVFGFWIYLMSDCILFSCLFASYAVLFRGVATGPTGKDIFNLKFVFSQTVFLLFSSITYSMVMISTNKNNIYNAINWLFLTFLFGLGFIMIESYEFYHLIINNFGPSRSAFLSSFFSLVLTHSVHVLVGLIWIVIMIIQINRRALTSINKTRLMCLSLFWHFLDIIWICVFTIVYLIGVML
ncbi:Cytochrome bo(3) ubiquinol oxidase subunit 3 [Candidatus Ecksteinia adelgidicola]|nr:Cytochrome bo(3) ubiquinol oxidase subunit 3 [Candidatus Ecksteinia adelgidicola]